MCLSWPSVGQKVASLMDCMGRSFDGSYAQYALLPVRHVFPVETDLLRDALAAVPETRFTTWGSLFECLQFKPEDTLLIRGATCALVDRLSMSSLGSLRPSRPRFVAVR